MNEVAYGNEVSSDESDHLLSNDTDPDGDPLSVVSVDGVPLTGGSVTVASTLGELSVDQDGSYTYRSTSTIKLYGFDDADQSFESLGLFTLDTAAQARVSSTDEGVGVKGTGRYAKHDTPDQIQDEGNVLIADLGGSTTRAEFDVTRLYANEASGELGKWYAYDADGELVGEGVFGHGMEGFKTKAGSDNQGTVEVYLDGVAFQYLAFEGLPYEQGDEQYTQEKDGGDFLVSNIRVQDTFSYRVEGALGESSEATLTIEKHQELRNFHVEAPPLADPVLTTAELVDNDLPEGVDGDAIIFKSFTVGGGVDAEELGKQRPSVIEVNPSLGGSDDSTHESDLVFHLAQLPSYGTLYLKTGNSYVAIDALEQAPSFGTGDQLYWAATSSEIRQAVADHSAKTVSGKSLKAMEQHGVNIYAYDFDGSKNDELLHFNAEGVGVLGGNRQGQAPNQLGHRNGRSEEIVVDFDKATTEATITVTRLIFSEGEVGKVSAYLDGQEIGSWTFSGYQPGATLDGVDIDFTPGNGFVTSGTGKGTFSLEGVVFDQLRFTATEYADGASRAVDDSSDYFIEMISFKVLPTAEYAYHVTDEAGYTSAPVSVVINAPAVDTAVPESGAGASLSSTSTSVQEDLVGDGIVVETLAWSLVSDAEENQVVPADVLSNAMVLEPSSGALALGELVSDQGESMEDYLPVSEEYEGETSLLADAETGSLLQSVSEHTSLGDYGSVDAISERIGRGEQHLDQ